MRVLLLLRELPERLEVTAVRLLQILERVRPEQHDLKVEVRPVIANQSASLSERPLTIVKGKRLYLDDLVPPAVVDEEEVVHEFQSRRGLAGQPLDGRVEPPVDQVVLSPDLDPLVLGALETSSDPACPVLGPLLLK